MTRKVFLFLTVVFCLCMANKTMAYDFSAVNNGQTIYYKITSSTTPYRVAVTYGVNVFNTYSGAVVIPSTVTNGSYTYSVHSIGDSAFNSCSGLTSVTFPNSLNFIYDYAFRNCSGLTSLSIPNSVTSIGYYVFNGCSSLTSITVSTDNTNYSSVDGVLFNKTQTNLSFFPAGKTGSYTIPNSVIYIGTNAFYSCSGLTSVTIPNSVTTIGQRAFSNCSGLTSVTIPNSVTSIGYFAFGNCSGLTEIYVKAVTPPSISDAGTFINVSKSIPVHVPCASLTDYLRATNWNYFTNIIGGIPGVTVQSSDATMGSTTITKANTSCTDNTAIIEATANTGYRFLQWNDGITTNPRTITVTQDTTFTAEFEVVVQMYHVTVTVNNQSMGIVTGSADYAANSTATISATPNTGYRFVQWHDGDISNPRTITVTKDTTFTAEFAAITYHVTVSANDPSMGSVTGSGDYAVNSTATISATPNTGYRFVQWNDGDITNPRTITVTQDIGFTAMFEAGTAITDIEASTISIYPNPATDDINITLPENMHQAVFTLYDMQGKVLLRKEISNQETVSVSNLAKGVYIYNVTTDKQKHVGQLIINVSN